MVKHTTFIMNWLTYCEHKHNYTIGFTMKSSSSYNLLLCSYALWIKIYDATSILIMLVRCVCPEAAVVMDNCGHKSNAQSGSALALEAAQMQ